MKKSVGNLPKIPYFCAMAGHSKWANIKRRKEVQDAKKTRLYHKLLREISAAVQMGGSDQTANPRLRVALQNARGMSLPKDRMERAIQKGGEKKGDNYQEFIYEGYGPEGVGVVVMALTDNVHRTVAHVRSLFTKYQGSLGKKGSLSHLFERKAFFVLQKSKFHRSLDETMLDWIEGGVEEFFEEGDRWQIIAPFQAFGRIQRLLEEEGIEAEEVGTPYIPHASVALGSDARRVNEKLLQALEENEDVQHLYHNMEEEG